MHFHVKLHHCNLMWRVRTAYIYIKIFLITYFSTHTCKSVRCSVHFTKKCLLCYVDLMILSKMEWFFFNLEFVLAKFKNMIICILSFCVSYFSSKLEIRKEIKTERQDDMLYLNTLLLQIKVVSLCNRLFKGCCPGSSWNTETQQCERKKTAI